MESKYQTLFMSIAIEEAKKSALRGEVPVGAVIVMDNKVIAQSGNKMESINNPLFHAEMIVLHEASKILNKKGMSIKHAQLDLYVTLEPCTMCAYAISLCRINNLFYGASDPKRGGINYGSKVFDQVTSHHKPKIIGGVKKNISQKLLKDFFKNIRTTI